MAFGFGSKNSGMEVELKNVKLEDILTKGMGRSFIPAQEKEAIRQAIAKYKGASAASSYLQSEKPVARVMEVMRILEKEGIMKPYQGTRVLKDYKRKWEVMKKNIQQLTIEELKKERAKEALLSGEDMPDITKRTMKRLLTPKEVREIEQEKRKKEAVERVSSIKEEAGINNGDSMSEKKPPSGPPSVPLRL